MGRFFSRFDSAYFLLVPVVLYATWPWFMYRFRAILPFCIVVLWLVLKEHSRKTFLQEGKFNFTFVLTVAFFLLHSFLGNVFAILGHGQFVPWRVYGTTLSALGHYLIVHYSFVNMKFKEMLFLTTVALIGTSFAGIAAIRGGMIEGFEGGRLLTTSWEMIEGTALSQDKWLAYQIGAANYKMTYSFAMFAPPLLFAVFKVKRPIPLLLLLTAAVACILNVKNSGLGTPVFVLAFGFLLVVCAKFGLRKKSLMIIGTAAITLLLTFTYTPGVFKPIVSTVNMLGRAFPDDSSIRKRCEAVANAFEGDETSYAFLRYQLQRRSIDSFFEHPVAGAGIYMAPHPKAYEVGGHSCLLDRLGQAGVIGGFFYFGFLLSLFSYYKQMTISFGFPRRWLSVPLICIFTYIFTCVANPSPTFPEILYYMPGLLLLTLKYGGGKPDMCNHNYFET